MFRWQKMIFVQKPDNEVHYCGDKQPVFLPVCTHRGTVAHKIMQKYGFKEGQGLGKHEQGLSTALSVEKTSKRGGKIIIGDAAEKRKERFLFSSVKVLHIYLNSGKSKWILWNDTNSCINMVNLHIRKHNQPK